MYKITLKSNEHYGNLSFCFHSPEKMHEFQVCALNHYEKQDEEDYLVCETMKMDGDSDG